MPFAQVKTMATTQVRHVKPWVSPYQGTVTAAMAKVSTNIRVLTQTRGALGSLRVVSLMRICKRP